MLRNSQVQHLTSFPAFKPNVLSTLSFSTNADKIILCGYLVGIAPPDDFEEEVTPDPNGETITLEAKMQPLLLDSMTKSKDGFLGVSKGSFSSSQDFLLTSQPGVPLH